jgi:hypothetical protein
VAGRASSTSCCGYYRYDEGHRPEFAGEPISPARGQPAVLARSLDVAGKRIVVIGSGATAVTLVPALAASAANVTMLQRSPSYVVARPASRSDRALAASHLPERLAYAATRWKNVLLQAFFYRLARRRPEHFAERIVAMAAEQVGPACDAAVHFTPRYKPWDQRLCLVPDGDLFAAIRTGRAAVVTGHHRPLRRPTAFASSSGETLRADIVVVATGSSSTCSATSRISVDGEDRRASEAMVYKGMMLSDVPNLALCFGYVNASWTLKADLTAEYVCRLLRHMDRAARASSCPRRDPSVGVQPFLSFTSGTSSAPARSFPSRARAGRGRCTRTTSWTCSRSASAASTTACCASASRERRREAAGRVAVVTGAGSGIGPRHRRWRWRGAAAARARRHRRCRPRRHRGPGRSDRCCREPSCRRRRRSRRGRSASPPWVRAHGRVDVSSTTPASRSAAPSSK